MDRIDYNLEALSFLIGSLKEVMNTFGKTADSLKFYKGQVDGLMSLGQVGYREAEIINNLIEPVMKANEQNLSKKWDLVEDRINQFIDSVNKIMSFDNKTAWTIVVAEMKRTGKIDATVCKLLCNIFGIDISQTVIKEGSNTYKFGQMPSRITVENDNKEVKNRICEILTKINSMNNANDVKYIKIKNPNAVCSGDPLYLYISIDNVIKNIKEMRTPADLSTSIMSLVEGQPYEIVAKRTVHDVDLCSRAIKTINWVILEDENYICHTKINWSLLK